MNDSLRIALLIILFLVVAALVVNDRLKKRSGGGMGERVRRRSGGSNRRDTPQTLTPPPPPPEPIALGESDGYGYGDDVEIIPIPPRGEGGGGVPSFTALRDPPVKAPPMIPKLAPVAKTPTSSPRVPLPVAKPKPVPIFEEQVLTLTVVAGSGYAFAGESLRQIIEQIGFQYGRKKIFHRMDGGEPLISLANIKEPGTFPVDELEEFLTPGIALFAQLPSTQAGVELVEELFEVGELLAEQLQGHLCDARGLPLSDEVRRQMRQIAEPYPAMGL